jgi:hypothetical protein
MISERRRIGKDLVGCVRGLILRYPGICLEGLRKTRDTLSKDTHSPGRDMYPVHPEYNVRVLTILP